MSWTTVEDDLYRSLKAMMPNLPIVIADQNGPELQSPYCVINLITMSAIGREQEHHYTTQLESGDWEFTTETRETYEALVRFFFLGKDSSSESAASNLASAFHSALNISNKRYYFAQNNLSIMRKSSVRRAPVVRETDRYNSYSVEVTFAYCLKTTENPEYFDTVSVSGEITGTANDPYLINEFTIPS